MPSTFTVNAAAGYEQVMGRWSRRLAPLFIDFAGLADGERIADVGCGNGSLAFALPKAANVAEVAAVDISPIFVAEVERLNTDPRINVRQADAVALPFADAAFDRALSLLVLHFVPEPRTAIAEMRRVVKPGGTVAAAVWDHSGGMSGMRMLWDTAAALDDGARAARARYLNQPMTGPDELRQGFLAEGLGDVVQDTITIRMDYAGFDDYWAPFAAGEAVIGKYVGGLASDAQAALAEAVRAAYEGGRLDGPRSFAASAWVCRGTVA